MEEFERMANWLNDRDSEWWPFLFMRPAPEQRMTTWRVLVLAVLYGAFAGAFVDMCVALAGKTERVHVLLFPAVLTVTFFALFRTTCAHAWNRRAARLVSENIPRDPWTRRES